jgi:hypothetical protein
MYDIPHDKKPFYRRRNGETIKYEALDDKIFLLEDWLELEHKYKTTAVDRRAYFQQLLDETEALYDDKNIQCPLALVPALIGLEYKRVEVTYDNNKKRFTVGKSQGCLPVHLEMVRNTSPTGTIVRGAPYTHVHAVHKDW